MGKKDISSLEEFVAKVRANAKGTLHVWFRGEPGDVPAPLLPKLYRKSHDENDLLQFFRMKAPIFTDQMCPDRKATDQWLYLAQHVGLPTRLLDWTESALVALYFALREQNPVVWMLRPTDLNQLSIGNSNSESSGLDEFPIPWFQPKDDPRSNIGNVNIRGAWEKDKIGTQLPVAIHPTNIHPRMSVQRSCFTVHGKRKDGLATLAPHCVNQFKVAKAAIAQMNEDLKLLGIGHASIYPDLDGLAHELSSRF